jgi:hypothetical protein
MSESESGSRRKRGNIAYAISLGSEPDTDLDEEEEMAPTPVIAASDVAAASSGEALGDKRGKRTRRKRRKSSGIRKRKDKHNDASLDDDVLGGDRVGNEALRRIDEGSRREIQDVDDERLRGDEAWETSMRRPKRVSVRQKSRQRTAETEDRDRSRRVGDEDFQGREEQREEGHAHRESDNVSVRPTSSEKPGRIKRSEVYEGTTSKARPPTRPKQMGAAWRGFEDLPIIPP